MTEKTRDPRFYIGCVDPFGHIDVRAEVSNAHNALIMTMAISMQYKHLVWAVVDVGGYRWYYFIAGEMRRQSPIEIDSPEDVAEYDIAEWQDGYLIGVDKDEVDYTSNVK